MKPEELQQLFDLAADKVGSDYKLAQLLDLPRQRISNWRTGKQTMAPEDVAIVASIAGLDAVTWAMRAMVAKHEGSAKGDRLMKAVGKALAVTGAVVATSGAHAMAISSTIKGLLDTMYITVKLWQAPSRLRFTL